MIIEECETTGRAACKFADAKEYREHEIQKVQKKYDELAIQHSSLATRQQVIHEPLESLNALDKEAHAEIEYYARMYERCPDMQDAVLTKLDRCGNVVRIPDRIPADAKEHAKLQMTSENFCKPGNSPKGRTAFMFTVKEPCMHKLLCDFSATNQFASRLHFVCWIFAFYRLRHEFYTASNTAMKLPGIVCAAEEHGMYAGEQHFHTYMELWNKSMRMFFADFLVFCNEVGGLSLANVSQTVEAIYDFLKYTMSGPKCKSYAG